MPYRSPTSLSSVGEMSQPATTSNRSGMASSTGRWTTWATSPSPMMPVRSLVTSWVLRCRLVGSVAGGERRVERGGWGLDPGEPANERQCVRCADRAVHAGVLPLDGDGAVVADRVEHPEHGLPRNVPVPGGDEVPPAARVAPRQV